VGLLARRHNKVKELAMNRWRAMAAAGLGLMVLALAGQAQDNDKRQPERRQAAPTREAFGPPARVLEQLKLTDEQKKKIADLTKEFQEKHKGDVEKFRTESQKIREELGKARGDREAAEKARKQMDDLVQGMRKLEDELDGKIAGVLNADQKKQFEDAKKALTSGERPAEGRPGTPDRTERRPEGPGRFGGPPNPLMIPGVAERLNLTAEQKEKLAKLRKEYEDKMTDVLTADQKKQLEEMKSRFGPGRRPEGDRPKERTPEKKDK
jgi:Spy/CpxP family protein refolding chaperone